MSADEGAPSSFTVAYLVSRFLMAHDSSKVAVTCSYMHYINVIFISYETSATGCSLIFVDFRTSVELNGIFVSLLRLAG